MRTAIFLVLVMSLSAVLGCGRRVPPVPPVARPAPVRQPIVVYESFRVATFDFGAGEDPIDRGLTDGLPAALLTELRDTGRFSLFEGGNLRNRGGNHDDGEALTERNANAHVDGYLGGTITKWAFPAGAPAGEVCADVRLANAWNHEVLYAVSACIGVTRAAGRLELDRAAVQTLAQEIGRAIPRIENANVMSAEGDLLLIDRGSSSGVARGMVAYLRGTGDLQSDDQLHRRISSYTGVGPAAENAEQQVVANQLPAIVAEVIIVSVDENTALATLVRGTYALPGDTVFFK